MNISDGNPLEGITIEMLEQTAGGNQYRAAKEASFARVSLKLFEINPEAYKPRYVSLGPYHYVGSGFNGLKDVNVLSMEATKQECMLRLLNATSDPMLTLSNCKEYVEKYSYDILQCYREQQDISEELVGSIVLVDVCFFLEFFLRMLDESGRIRFKSDYSIFWSLRRDAALLENQLPLFVITNLMNIIQDELMPVHSFGPLYRNLLCLVRLTPEIPQNIEEDTRLRRLEEDTRSRRTCRHLLYLVTGYHLCVDASTRRTISSIVYKSPRSIQLRNATQLKAAGVRFERAKGVKLLAIEFTNGVFKIPSLVVHDSTETLLINLLAYEHHQPSDPRKDSSYLASYVMLMMHLVETTKDLELLEHEGIIVNELGSTEDGSKMFRNVSKHVIILGSFYFMDLCREVEAFANSRHRRYMIDFRKVYFRNPWTVFSLLAAAAFLMLTVVQTVYTVLSFYQKV